jgi:protein disulfide-isomerase A1
MRTFDASPVHYAGEATHEGITAFMEKNSVPTLIEFSEDYIEPIFGKGNTAIILFTNEKDTAYGKVWAEAANTLKGDILFVVSGTKEGIQSRLAEFIGVTEADTPTIRLLSPGDEMAKFVYPGSVPSVSIDNIKTFFEDFKAGKLVTHLKSEPIPENKGALTTLVGLNYESIVLDETKDVLVKYYAPWCGHCKKLAPIWEELAESVADIPDLVIAKFDATMNEVKGLQIKGYPTLKFYPKGNKAGVDYDEGRELPDFKKYLEKNSSAYQAHHAPKSEEL